MEPTNASAQPSLEHAIDQGKRAFALGKYEQAVEHYATALEIMTAVLGEDAPETADLYFTYGQALLENARAQSSVLGHNQPEPAEDPADAFVSGSMNNGPLLSFSGDAEDTEDAEVDLFQEASKVIDVEENAEDDEDDEEDAEPEDDFNAAWDVLDLARAIYEKQRADGGDETIQLKLADTYVALGDVSLETEKFEQAITDYETSLGLKMQLLPTSSRELAEAHYKLSIVLDMTPGRLADSIVHAQQALESIETRLAELEVALPNSSSTVPVEKQDAKGKGKAKQPTGDVSISQLTTSQIQGELTELSGLKKELILKIEELKTSPNENTTSSAPALAAAALDKELNNGSVTVLNQQPLVNDLTGMMKKKKKVATADSSSAKRKAEDDGEGFSSEKKPRVEES